MIKKRGYFTVNIDGKNHVGHISMTCLYLITELRGIDLDGIGDVLGNVQNPRNFSDIVFCALKANALREGVEPSYSNSWEFLDILAEEKILTNVDFITEFTKAITEAKVFQNDDNLGVPRKVKKTTKDPK